MSTCSSLSMNDRIHVAYGSIISASLSIIGTICTIILIKIRNKKQINNDPQRKQLLNSTNSGENSGASSISPSNSSNNIISINSGSSGYSFFSEEINDNNNKNFNNFMNNLNNNKHYNNIANNNNKKSLNSFNSKGNQQTTKVSHFIINLSIADLLASIFILISNVMMIQFNDRYVETPFSSDSYTFINMMSICTLSNGFVSFSYISTFFWTLGIALYIYQQFSLTSTMVSSSSLSDSHKQSRNNKIIKILFYIINWVIPFILGGVIVSGSRIVDKSSFFSSASDGSARSLPWCSIEANVQLVAFYLPLMVSMIFTLFYTLLIKHRFSNNTLYGGSSTLVKLQNKIIGRLVLFCLVFFICWTPKLISFFITYFTSSAGRAQECKQMLWLEVLSATVYPLQGFCNFLSYTVFKKFKEFFKLKLNNISKLFKSNLNNDNKNTNNNFGSNLFYTNNSNNNTNNNNNNNNGNNNFYFTFSTFDLNEKGKK
ncbi:hypothetical protein DICPUDRAFT_75785 [Dictyostelium purpureum]|uniref:G-protein coupled receptors family 1 profile domain-containing protein n=1 Tax=Dictyostelium purpureum TaxID=5786 RepID=F0ZBN5_DICPU|nr:uncharacterized protein DICPUDRAFT_75785 [Dictyostelium purpureum]EGC38654.1 hypothetical protein DICPUDRAFT_75785 [Dictyostelium purpureum]|eukprot:XP_003284847.1 hypothetical protein DICPUDRAFT_75785 [Dictyostelium purpureum]